MWQWEQRHWCGPGDVRAVGCGSGSRDTGVALETLGCWVWQWEQRHWCGPGDVRAVGCGCGSRHLCGPGDVRAVGCGCGSRDTGVALETLGLLDVAVGAETLV